MKSDLTVALGFIAVMVLAFYLGFAEGQADVRGTTEVGYGTPYYQGVFYGRCLRAAGGEFCAHDNRENLDGSPKRR